MRRRIRGAEVVRVFGVVVLEKETILCRVGIRKYQMFEAEYIEREELRIDPVAF